jgi:hypothetical protein
MGLSAYEIHSINLVNIHCTKWLRARGLDYSLREVIRNDCHKTHAKLKAAKREQNRLDKIDEEFSDTEE